MPGQIPNLLVVDDEDNIRYFLERFFSREGLRVTTAASGEAALALLAQEQFDVMLLDLKMKGMSGLDVLSVVRERWPATTVIVLTAHASLESAVEALRKGAHDYLFKPCKTIDLREAIRTGLIKRQQQLQLQQLQPTLAPEVPASEKALVKEVAKAEGVPSFDRLEPDRRFLQHIGLIVDSIRHIVTIDGVLLELSPTEFDLLAYLVSEAPRVISPQELIREVQGYDSPPAEAAEITRSHMYHIRLKIKSVTQRPIIRTVRGVGYTLMER
jgi:DNA-binding response OmpR family regulator